MLGSFTIRRLRLLCLALTMTGVIAGCGGDDTTPTTTTPSPTDCAGTLTVAPTTAKAAIGKTQTFLASCDGTAIKASWTSSDVSIASIDATSGVATGVKAGTATITATAGKTATATFTVEDAATPKSLQVAPADAKGPVGTTNKFTATLNLSDGTTKDVTATATWSSSDTAIATIDATGSATAVKAGTATIKATSDGLEGTATFTVEELTVVSLDVTPPTATGVAGTVIDFKAIATFNDKTTKDVTADATWSSDKPDIATVDKGKAKGVAAGEAVISALFTGKTGSAKFSVSDATLTRLEISPTGAVGSAGGPNVDFKATAIFSDGKVIDVSADAATTWTSSDLTVATVDKGSAKPIKKGSTQISADYKGTKSSLATLAITDAIITSLVVTPATETIPAGTKQAFVAQATYSDGTSSNVTSSASWTSSTTTVATVDPTGLATGVAKGTTKITATFSGQTASADLTVSDTTLVSLTISPAGPLSLPLGAAQVFTAQGTFSDGTSSDISTLVSFSSSAAGRLVFAGASATAATLGDTTVSATLSGKTSNVVAVKVTDSAIVAISIEPAAPAALPIGGTLPFKAIATFTAGAPADITTSVLWASSDATIASISNAPGTNGKAFALKGGTTKLTASKDGKTSAAVNLTVKPSSVSLVSVSVSPVVVGATVKKGGTKAYKATGSYSDGSTADIVDSPLTAWDVITTGGTTVLASIATVGGPGTGSAGVVSANGATTGLPGGKALVRARQATVSGTSDLIIQETVVNSVQVSCAASANLLLCVPTGISYPIFCTAKAFYADGTTGDATADSSWTSSNASVAVFSKVVAGNAVFTVTGAGKAILVASVGGKTSWAVGQPDPVAPQVAVVTAGARTLTGTLFSSRPLANKMNRGEKFQYRLNATYTGGAASAIGCPTAAGFPTSYDVTAITSWSSTFPLTASLSNAEGTVGVATALEVGVTSVGASFGGINQTTPLTVADRCINKLVVSPVNPTVPADVLVKLTVAATYSDGLVENLSPSFGSGSFLTFAPAWTGNTNGVYLPTWEYLAKTGAQNVTASLNAIDGACGTTAVTSVATVVTVNASLLPTSLIVQPIERTIPKGGFADFIARATFGSAGTYNVSFVGNIPFVTVWNDDPALNFNKDLVGVVGGEISYRFSQFAGAPGAAAGVYPAGLTSATAKYKTQGAAAQLKVEGRGVKRVDVIGSQIAGTSYPVGVKPRFKALITYTDDTTDTTDTLSGVTWESSDPSKISFASPSSNVATTNVAGNVSIAATFAGVSSDPAAFVVNANVLCTITITSTTGSNTMVQSATLPLNIIGLYRAVGCAAGGQNVEIGGAVAPSSGDTSIVDAVTVDTGSTAQSKAKNGGPVTLTFSKDGRVGTINITVNGTGCITGVKILDPATAITLPQGGPIDVLLECTYSGAPITDRCKATTDGGVATFAIAGGAGTFGVTAFPGGGTFGSSGRGTITGTAGATRNFTATIAGASVCVGIPGSSVTSAPVVVTRGTATLSGVALSPASTTVPRGATQQYRVDATYSGAFGTGVGSYDVSRALGTALPRRLFTPSALVTVQNNARVRAGTTDGSVTINADYDGLSSTFVTLNISGLTRTGISVTAAPNQLAGCAGVDACYPEGGMALQLTAREIMSDGSFGADITSSVTWTLEAPTVAGAALDGTGLFTTPTDVTGNQTQVVKASDGTLTKTFQIRIVDGAVTGIALFKGLVAAATDTVPQGLKVQYDARVTVAGSQFWATRNVNWTSSDPTKATVVSTGGGAGQLTALAVGTTNITAARGTGTSPVLLVTVALPSPVSVYCTPAAPTGGTVSLGSNIQIRVWTKNSTGADTDVTLTAGAGAFSNFAPNLTTTAFVGTFTGAVVTGATPRSVKVSYLGLPASAAGADSCPITVTP